MAGQNKAAARALNILSLFASENSSYSASTLRKKLGLTQNSVTRALETLVHAGYLVRDTTGVRYELGPGILQLRSPRWDKPEIRSWCRPFMEQLSEKTRQSVHLLLHSGNRAVVVESVEGLDDMFRLTIGTAFPLHVSPGARCILAALPDEDVERYIEDSQPLENFTPGTITEAGTLWDDVRQVRKQGFAISREDFRLGRIGIALPVIARDDRPHGSIVIAGSRDRMSQDDVLGLLPVVRPIMDEIGRIARLYSVQPPGGLLNA